MKKYNTTHKVINNFLICQIWSIKSSTIITIIFTTNTKTYTILLRKSSTFYTFFIYITNLLIHNKMKIMRDLIESRFMQVVLSGNSSQMTDVELNAEFESFQHDVRELLMSDNGYLAKTLLILFRNLYLSTDQRKCIYDRLKVF